MRVGEVAISASRRERHRNTEIFISQQRDAAMRFMRGFIRGMHRYRTDKEYSKRVLGKYARSPTMSCWKEPGRTMRDLAEGSASVHKAIQFMIENQFKTKRHCETREFCGYLLVDQLERSGFIDSVYK
jgi:hypothetical protein